MAELATQLNTMLDRLQQDLKRLSDFSSDIAHELRTPLSNMMTQTHVILSQEADARTYREALVSNAEEMQSLARMTSDMLYLAKTENGLNLSTSESVDLAFEMASVVDFYDALADEKGLQVRTSGNARVQGDRLMIRRALSNLLSNAIRHAASGSVVDVAITREADRAVLRMANDGQDIASADLPQIFNRFYRADPSRQRQESAGTGLGLSITKAIMQAHRGSVSAESSNGRTVFTLSFGVDAACAN
jgi:two-component system heavy metal sensor histidine kinase CusS